ncbi:MAG TPA: efflux RND transporter periplasmic adaptor subunit [Woeseiaceae bacterium]|nr:efflux RND transporter periplasmic adaptor subunit [Woeseiaceae bacterium]
MARLLLVAVVLVGASLSSWKYLSIREGNAAARSQPEPTEVVTAAVAEPREWRPTTTAVGTVLALRSITLRNELPGTVERVALTPGEIVEQGEVLVALDVSVEKAELAAQKARAALAQTVLERTERLIEKRAVAVEDLDRARAERDIALAEVARIEAVIERKTIRAPFRARVGIADVHPGQYLSEGTLLTTLQGVDQDAHVDFAVEQRVARALAEGSVVEITGPAGSEVLRGTVTAVDARVDPDTRNATVRARVDGAGSVLAPGASVRVRVPTGPERVAVTVPVTAVRRGPAGDHVFVLVEDEDGKLRAQARRVAIGTVLGDAVVIREGIAAGEQVAASGSFKLRNAVLVAIDDRALASTAAAGGL